MNLVAANDDRVRRQCHGAREARACDGGPPMRLTVTHNAERDVAERDIGRVQTASTTTGRSLARVTAAIVVVFVALFTTWMLRGDSASAVSDQSVSASASVRALQNAYVDVLGRVQSSVVEISTMRGLGSGVIYDTDGNIVTNAHVVAGATDVQVTLADG